MTKLSKYLSLEQATKSLTAIRHGIDNVPSERELAAMRKVAEGIHTPLCEHFGILIPVSSFYRSPELNRLVGGAANSQHVSGEAMDLDCDGLKGAPTNAQVFDFIRRHLDWDQLIWEFGDSKSPAWVHASLNYDGDQRRKLTRAVKVAGRTSYLPFA